MAGDPLQNEIDIKIRAFVAAASGISSNNVIPGNDPHPAPAGSYATALQINTKGRGVDSEVARPHETDPEKFDLFHSGVREITYSVQFYRDGAADYIESLLSFPATTPGQIWLGENNLTWKIAGDIVNLDSLIDSKFEIRRAVEITLKYESKREIEINKLGSVEIDFDLSAETDIHENLEVNDA